MFNLASLDDMSRVRYTAALLSERLKVNISDAALPPELVQMLNDRAAGNPKHIKEMLQAILKDPPAIRVLENGRIVIERDLATIPVPDKMRGLVLQEFDAMEEDHKSLLRLAAEFRHGFTTAMLLGVSKTYHNDGQLQSLAVIKQARAVGCLVFYRRCSELTLPICFFLPCACVGVRILASVAETDRTGGARHSAHRACDSVRASTLPFGCPQQRVLCLCVQAVAGRGRSPEQGCF
jgi:hypothetical protein